MMAMYGRGKTPMDLASVLYGIRLSFWRDALNGFPYSLLGLHCLEALSFDSICMESAQGCNSDTMGDDCDATSSGEMTSCC